MNIKKLAAVGLVATLFIAAAGCYLQFYRSRPIGSGPAGPRIPDTPFSKVWSDKPILLIGLGDSVTAGFGARRGPI
jgi:hypothetical protein